MAALDLRPLSLGELLDRTFFLYRRHFLLFVGIAAIPYSFFFVINLATALLPLLARSAALRPSATRRDGRGGIGGGLFALVAVIVGFIAFLFSVGATVFAVSEIYTGRQTSIRESLAPRSWQGRDHFWRLVFERAHFDRRIHRADHPRNLSDVPHLRGDACRVA